MHKIKSKKNVVNVLFTTLTSTAVDEYSAMYSSTFNYSNLNELAAGFIEYRTQLIENENFFFMHQNKFSDKF